MWDLPGPGLEPTSPALAGGFLTIAPPGKTQKQGSESRQKRGIYWTADQRCLPLMCSAPVKVLPEPSLISWALLTYMWLYGQLGALMQEQSLNAPQLVIHSWGWLRAVLQVCEPVLWQNCCRELWGLFVAHGGQHQGEKARAENPASALLAQPCTVAQACVSLEAGVSCSSPNKGTLKAGAALPSRRL